MASIYRKYRPQTFSEIVGQNHIKLTLQNELESDQTVQAYLFCGPRGLGKTTAARIFAKSLNCENRSQGDSEPCNKCNACLGIKNNNSLDIVEIDAASNTGVDNVRENIIDNVRFTPHSSKFKIFIIDEVHMLSISAFNALLKTLEEPPAHAVFILCTTEIHKVPETIISRCQRFDFKKVPAKDAVKRLQKIAGEEGIKIDDEVFDIIAQKSEGCMRDAEGLLGQILSLGSKQITKEQVDLILPTSDLSSIMSFVELIFAKDIASSLEFINKLSDEGVDLEIFNKELIEFLRKLILVKTNAVKSNWLQITDKISDKINNILADITPSQLAFVTKIFLDTAVELKSALIPQLPLELAVVKICSSGDTNNTSNTSGNLPSSPAKPFVFKNPAIELNNKKKEIESKDIPAVLKQNKKSITATLEDIKKDWTNIISIGHGKGRDLLFINSSLVWPVRLAGDELEIGFKYELHKDRFESNGNKDLFAEAIKEVIGEIVNLKTKVLKPSELAELEIAEEEIVNAENPESGVKVTEDNILDQVLTSFGGNVVE